MPLARLSCSLFLTRSFSTPDFNSFIDVFCCTDLLSPSLYVSSPAVKTHSTSQACTPQVSLNDFFINSSHFLILLPPCRKCFNVQVKDRLMPPCPVLIHVMFCFVDRNDCVWCADRTRAGDQNDSYINKNPLTMVLLQC